MFVHGGEKHEAEEAVLGIALREGRIELAQVVARHVGGRRRSTRVGNQGIALPGRGQGGKLRQTFAALGCHVSANVAEGAAYVASPV